MVCEAVKYKNNLSEAELLTVKKALEVAVAVEATDKNAKELQSTESAQLGRVEQSESMHRSNKPCYRCGRNYHTPSDCKYREYIYYNCSKKGYLAKVCQSRQQTEPKPANYARNETTRGKPNWVKASNSTTDSNTDRDALKPDEAIFCIKETRTHSLHVKLELNNALVPFEVDTGAAVTIMSDSSFK